LQISGYKPGSDGSFGAYNPNCFILFTANIFHIWVNDIQHRDISTMQFMYQGIGSSRSRVAGKQDYLAIVVNKIFRDALDIAFYSLGRFVTIR